MEMKAKEALGAVFAGVALAVAVVYIIIRLLILALMPEDFATYIQDDMNLLFSLAFVVLLGVSLLLFSVHIHQEEQKRDEEASRLDF